VVLWGSYFDHALAWEERMEDPNILIVTYEELKQVEQHDDSALKRMFQNYVCYHSHTFKSHLFYDSSFTLGSLEKEKET